MGLRWCAEEENMNKFFMTIGICLLLLPIGFQEISKRKQQNIISTYEQELKQVSREETERILSEARKYNQILYEEGVADMETYEKQLVFSEKRAEMMGSITIPKIECKLPIQKGTESDSLSNAVGHVKESSLPVGGTNTHCVLSGHRGLPGQELFTRLDELKEKDTFYVNVGGQQLVYRVCKIQTVKPDNVNAVAVEKGRDLMSLVTCTPYGLNTHRLVITGERIPEAMKVEAVSGARHISKWNLIPGVVAGGSLLILTIQMIKNRKRRKERRDEQYRGKAARRRRRKNFLLKSRKHVQRCISIGKGL